MTQVDYGTVPASRKATFSIPSILSLAAAIGSFIVDRPGIALMLSIAAAVLGVIGVIVAILPGIRGGILSILAIVMGAIGILTAIIRFIS